MTAGSTREEANVIAEAQKQNDVSLLSGVAKGAAVISEPRPCVGVGSLPSKPSRGDALGGKKEGDFAGEGMDWDGDDERSPGGFYENFSTPQSIRSVRFIDTIPTHNFQCSSDSDEEFLSLLMVEAFNEGFAQLVDYVDSQDVATDEGTSRSAPMMEGVRDPKLLVSPSPGTTSPVISTPLSSSHVVLCQTFASFSFRARHFGKF